MSPRVWQVRRRAGRAVGATIAQPRRACPAAFHARRRRAAEPIVAKDGDVVVPDRPGLGVTLNADFVEPYRVKR